MVGSTAIVGWIAPNGINSGIKKFYLRGKSPNLVTLQPQDQGLQLQNMFISTLQNQIYMAFQVMYNTPSTYVIYAVGPAGQLPSVPNFALSQHRTMYSTVMNYGTGKSRSVIVYCILNSWDVKYGLGEDKYHFMSLISIIKFFWEEYNLIMASGAHYIHNYQNIYYYS